MRIFVALLVALAIGGGVLAYRKHEAPTAVSTKDAKPAHSPASSPSENSQHNWPKNALDRAADVKRQVLQQRKENGEN